MIAGDARPFTECSARDEPDPRKVVAVEILEDNLFSFRWLTDVAVEIGAFRPAAVATRCRIGSGKMELALRRAPTTASLAVPTVLRPRPFAREHRSEPADILSSGGTPQGVIVVGS